MTGTAKQIMEEINKKGDEIMSCPVCNSDDCGSHLEVDAPPYWVMHCNHCDSSWNEYYKWDGIDNLEIGKTTASDTK